MEEIHITLTEPQIRALDNLWVKVHDAHLDDKKGAVIAMQPRESGWANCIFVPHEQVKKIVEILKEIT